MSAADDRAAVQLYLGDCLAVLRSLPAESIDACVTDPPYGIGFMGHEWDTFDPLKFEAWSEGWAREVFRILKPGAHLVACGAPRSSHRMACGIEDAGFEMRDSVAWLFGSGFPKSLNLGEGLGTALKPAHEPIVLARKPLRGTVAATVAAYGTGALNVDDSRIGDDLIPGASGSGMDARRFREGTRPRDYSAGRERPAADPHVGRWPANVVLDDLAAMVLDEQSGELTSHDTTGIWSGATKKKYQGNAYGEYTTITKAEAKPGRADTGGASRFFYCAKPSQAERDMGCGQRRNGHPTVKPIALMRWLVKLVTPLGGTVIDPFLGSGTTGIACVLEMRPFLGIEREAQYLALAQARINDAAPLFAVTT